jgi:hypothetical protein
MNNSTYASSKVALTEFHSIAIIRKNVFVSIFRNVFWFSSDCDVFPQSHSGLVLCKFFPLDLVTLSLLIPDEPPLKIIGGNRAPINRMSGTDVFTL